MSFEGESTPGSPEAGHEPPPALTDPRHARRVPGRARTFLTTIRAVLTRELRWRMRGKRAFVIATVAVLFLGFIVFAITSLMTQAAMDEARLRLLGGFDDGRFGGAADLQLGAVSGEAAARIGQTIYGGVLGVLTTLTLLVAPALASGVISSEREKQTMELLVTTPVSTLGMLVGKLISSLAYVLLLLIASLPLMAVVFAFGGVAPEDVLRAYVVILAIAFGSAALGLFLSALIGRTQIATVVAYLILFALVVGTFALHAYLVAMSYRDDVVERPRERAPAAMLLLNPLVTDIDLMCNAVPDVGVFCSYIAQVQGVEDNGRDLPPNAFWPRSVLAFIVTGIVLVLLSTQLISPSRRWRAWRRVKAPPADPPATAQPEGAA
jgi:ABC-type transport system involved in multi-copper enzyme maturation permease subunit